ncbi:MAG: 50S ribosomal protein L25 [Deltaproteobacteria bacterium]|nr:50S ribosomal protein L25 [Deltaproteobacteria bacterium]|tara:strand:+ start:7793 stop:8368 length:576 start_codon:yes stop_codon:yes gene_type:complete
MMEAIMNSAVVAISNRESFGKGTARTLRREGSIPAIAYSKGNAPLHFAVSSGELLKGLKVNGKNTLLELKAEDGTSHNVMLKKMQRHPVDRRPMHADFLLVDLDAPVKVQVKLVYEGRPVGTTRGGVLETHRVILDVECVPTKIPSDITIDISGVDTNETLTVADLNLPEGITALHEPSEVLVAVPSVIAD